MRNLRIVLWVAVAVALFAVGALAVSGVSLRGGDVASTPRPGAPLGGAFSLIDHRGEPVSEATVFRGKPSITLFGFTHCPDVCPTGLMQMAKWADELGPDADKLNFVFVTVDPERDTPEVMRDYVTAFSDRIIGISGPAADVMQMTKSYKVYSRKVPIEGSDYTMDHTASMILQDASGNFVGTIDNKESPEVGLTKLKRLVAG